MVPCPLAISWFIIPSDHQVTINHRVIGALFANLAYKSAINPVQSPSLLLLRFSHGFKTCPLLKRGIEASLSAEEVERFRQSLDAGRWKPRNTFRGAAGGAVAVMFSYAL